MTTKFRRSSLCPVLVLVAMGWHGHVAASEFRTELEATLEHDGNPARSAPGEGVPSEFVQGLTLAMTRSEAVDQHGGWVWRTAVSTRLHSRYRQLNELAAEVGMTYRIQPEVGFSKPWYEVAWRLDRRVHDGSAIRDDTRLVVGLSTGANLTDRISVNGGLHVTRAVADREHVFDQTERALKLGATYRLAGAQLIYGKWTYARGDRVFGSLEDYPPASWIKVSADDLALSADQYAYRTDARTHEMEAGWSMPAGVQSFVDVAWRHSSSAAQEGHTYKVNQMFLGWRWLVK